MCAVAYLCGLLQTHRTIKRQRMSEQELARLCAEGDTKAQTLLYTTYAGRLLSLCRRYCRHDEDAHDMMQDAVIKAIENMKSFTYLGNGSLYAWMSRLAVNMAVSRLRKKRFLLVSLDSPDVPDLPDPPEEELAGIPREKMMEMISTLPQVKRAIFNMYCIDGYSHKEISERLGISEKSSASSLAKARKLLMLRISDYLKANE